MKKILSEKGQTLIEAVLALTIAVIIITAIVAAVNTGLNSAGANKSQNLATGLAQEGIDVLRNYKSQDFAHLKNNFPTGVYCLSEATPSAITGDNPCSPIAAGGEDEQRFIRKLYLNHSGKDARVNPTTTPCKIALNTFAAVTVNWTDSACRDELSDRYCHQIELTTCLADNNELPTP